MDVPSDGAPHKVPIDAQKLKVKFDYVAVPKLKEMMFLRGSLKNTLPYPLLPGNADLFIMQDFVGTTQLPHVAANDEAKMYFGEDRQIKVTYEQVKREKIGAGFLSKTEKLRLAYKITVQNLRKTPAEHRGDGPDPGEPEQQDRDQGRRSSSRRRRRRTIREF